jgi:hypothetical protein
MSLRAVAVTACLVATLVSWSLPAAPAAADDVGVVKVSRGAATVERSGHRLLAQVGMKIEEGDTIATGPDGAVGVTFRDNTLLSIGPGSSLVIERYAFDTTTHKGAFESSLLRGTLAAVSGKIAKQSPDAMKVRTPAAVLGVRGTEFLVRTAETAAR